VTERADQDEPIALSAFDELADEFAAKVGTKAHNAYYERPAMLSLLPDVEGGRMLDAGCGPGHYAEWLLDRGAAVVCLDVSPRMVELARERVGDRAEVRQADLAAPLDFLDDESFDGVLAPLVLDYIRDWRPLFAELHRLLRPGGFFLFSFEHPFSDFSERHMANYFDTEIVECVWRGFGSPVPVRCYRRSLGEVLKPIVECGFEIDAVLEPLPTPEFEKADPEDYVKLQKRPGFLCLRLRKPRS